MLHHSHGGVGAGNAAFLVTGGLHVEQSDAEVFAQLAIEPQAGQNAYRRVGSGGRVQFQSHASGVEGGEILVPHRGTEDFLAAEGAEQVGVFQEKLPLLGKRQGDVEAREVLHLSVGLYGREVGIDGGVQNQAGGDAYFQICPDGVERCLARGLL